jgi:hypothetical protein
MKESPNIERLAARTIFGASGAIMVGLVNAGLLRLAGDWTDDALARRRGVAAMVSLLAWLTALTAGRFIAYW